MTNFAFPCAQGITRVGSATHRFLKTGSADKLHNVIDPKMGAIILTSPHILVNDPTVGSIKMISEQYHGKSDDFWPRP
jgi:hypothetical protein